MFVARPKKIFCYLAKFWKIGNIASHLIIRMSEALIHLPYYSMMNINKKNSCFPVMRN